MKTVLFVALFAATSVFVGCSSHVPASVPAAHASAMPTIGDLLKPYEVLAAKHPASRAPVVGGQFDLSRSTAVPPDIGALAFGSSPRLRSVSNETAEAYALVATSPTPRSTASRRATRDDETCYFLLVYEYNVRTGEIVHILGVIPEGCTSSGLPPDDGGGGGSIAMTTTCNVPGASAAINALIASSATDQSLLAAISASNGPATQPTFTVTTLPAGTVAQAAWDQHTVYYDPAQVQTAINSGQDLGAIIEHEILHLWMETADITTGVQPHPFPDIGTDNQVTVTLDDGTKLTFDQTATRNPTTGHIVLSPGYAGYEHILIHQILVNQNPGVGDQTGALKSAFLEATSVTLPGGQAQKITDAGVAANLANSHKTSGTDGKPPTLPSGGTYSGCSTSATGASGVSRKVRSPRRPYESVTYNGEIYDVPWDGAVY